MMRIVILAPIHNSLYSRLVTWLLSQEKDIHIEAVVVRSIWNLSRLRSELHRDGSRLLKKISRKMVLGDNRFSKHADSLKDLQSRVNLPGRSLDDIARILSIRMAKFNDFNSPDCIHLLKQLSPDLILFTGGGLLREEILNIPSIGILNCHSGILPNYRGMDVVEWTAIEENIQPIGIGASLHLMDKGVDTGPILISQRLDLKPDDTFESIRERIDSLLVSLMVKGVCGLRDGAVQPQPQLLDHGRQYFILHPRLRSCAKSRLKAQLP